MRLEKREITLNEQDTLADVVFLEKALLFEYVETLSKVDRKETRERLIGFMKENCEDLFLLNDLLKKVKE